MSSRIALMQAWFMDGSIKKPRRRSNVTTWSACSKAADSLARARKDRSEYARQAKESAIISRIGCLVAWRVGWSVGMASTLARE